MKKISVIFGLSLLFVACNNQKQTQSSAEEPEAATEVAPAAEEPNQGKALVQEMVEAIGGVETLKSLKDVEYEHTYYVPAEDKRDISLERYIFDGEHSWAKYTTRTKWVMPDIEGEIIQGYDGNESWVTVDGKLTEDSVALRLGDFFRKTNFYWFCMMFKQLDPGMTYEHKDKQNVDGIEYDIVKVGFEENVGDVQDTYVLYINPDTKLVDQFLFTVLDFGVTDPLLMKIEYQTMNGVKVPAFRKYIPADWDGNIKGEDWVEYHYKNVKFNNGFTQDMFKKPETAPGA